MGRLRFVFLVGLFGLVAFLPVFFRGLLFGFDSFATLSCVFGVECESLSAQSLAVLVWGFVPFGVLGLKLLALLCFIASLIVIFFIVCRFYSEKVALHSIFLVVCLSPILLFRFGEIENEILAIPLIWLTLLLLLNNTKPHKYAGIITFIIATGFWIGTLAYLPTLAILFTPIIIPLIILTITQHQKIIQLLNTNPTTTEQILFGAIYQLFGWIILAPLITKISNKKIIFMSLITLIPAMIIPSLTVLITPFITLATAELITKLKKQYLTYLTIIAITCYLGISFAFINQEPTQNEFQIIHKMLDLNTLGYPYLADLTYDYWIETETKQPLPYPRQTTKNYNTQPRPFIALTIKQLNCQTIDSERDLKLYLCN